MIIDLQRRIAEIGRIRIGQQVAANNGKKRPTKLTTFRLTSADRTRIQQAAMLYGGQPQEWDAPAGKQWEVITETDALNVVVPPSDMAFSQHYELWSGGGCQRRCNGQFESISDGPCVCDPDKRECAIHTRLSVMLRDLPGLGVWRIDTSGYYAAVELQGAVEVVQMAAGAGQMLPAKMRLDQRMIKRPGAATKRFAVPVLDIEVSPAQLLAGGAVTMIDSTPGTIAIEAPPKVVDGSAPLTPVPETVPEAPTASVKEQAAAKKPRRPRANAQQSIPATGLKPRTAAEANAKTAPPPPAPPAGEAQQPIDAVEMVTGPQLRKLSILRKQEGYADDEEGRAGWFAWLEAAVSRTGLTSNKDLTKAEASGVIDLLEEARQQDQQRMEG
ncbi:recombination directionality factor [Mycolicibacterium sp. XJ1819]